MYYNKVKTNFHAHTIYCGHAVGLPIDYLDSIKELNLDTLGFSEHAYIDIPRFHHTISSLKEMDEYYNEVQKLKSKTNIEILTGLEIDYIPSFIDYYKELSKKFDFLSLSIHFVYLNGNYSYATRFSSIDELILYKDYMLSGIKSKLFSYVNHPDLFLNDYVNNLEDKSLVYSLSEDIINCAIEYDMPIELNIAQFYRFNFLYDKDSIRTKFWELVGKKQSKVIINYDSHDPKEMTLERFNKVMEYANNFNLNIITDFRKCD